MIDYDKIDKAAFFKTLDMMDKFDPTFGENCQMMGFNMDFIKHFVLGSLIGRSVYSNIKCAMLLKEMFGEHVAD